MKQMTGLNILCLSQPLLTTEWLSLMGDKYQSSLPFEVNLVHSLEEANVIAWDGMITAKGAGVMKEVVAALKAGKVLLLQEDAMTMFKRHPYVEFADLDQIRYVELPGWTVLPEELLNALELCHQKLTNV